MTKEIATIERDYQDAAMSFASYGNSMHYPCYGLVEEAGELLDCTMTNEDLDPAHVIGELGDINWMLAGICKEFSIEWSDVMNSVHGQDEFTFAEGELDTACCAGSVMISLEASRIAGKVAKFIRKHDGLNPKLGLGRLAVVKQARAFNKDILDKIVLIIRIGIAIAKVLGYSFPMVLMGNIDKLTERKATGTIKGSGETVAERKANAEKEAC